MHSRSVGEREYLVVLEKEEPVVATLVGFAASAGIEGGWVSGLGSVKEAELGYYDLHRKTYLRRTFAEDVELVGASGNLAMKGAERILHLHATLSGPDLAAFAGHVFEARVAVTAEFHVRDFGRRVDRAPVESIGLSLIRAPGAAS